MRKRVYVAVDSCARTNARSADVLINIVIDIDVCLLDYATYSLMSN